MSAPSSLETDPIHLNGSLSAIPVSSFRFTPDGFRAYMAAHCSVEDPGRIVMIEHSSTDWPMWERHTAGDEVVIVISGTARFIQELDGDPAPLTLSAGEAVINPAGVWHTADVVQPFSAVYLTPCPGTEHRPR